MRRRAPNNPFQGARRRKPPAGPAPAIRRGVVGIAIDGRSREGRFLRTYERALIEHVGGSPSVVQRQLIHRAARLALHLELMDEKSLGEGGEGAAGFGPNAIHYYVAWS